MKLANVRSRKVIDQTRSIVRSNNQRRLEMQYFLMNRAKNDPLVHRSSGRRLRNESRAVMLNDQRKAFLNRHDVLNLPDINPFHFCSLEKGVVDRWVHSPCENSPTHTPKITQADSFFTTRRMVNSQNHM